MSKRNNRRKRHPNRHYRSKEKRKEAQPAAKAQSSEPTSRFGKYRKPLCKHWRAPFRLEGGLTVTASAYSDRPWPSDPVPLDPAPDFGLYFDDLWASERLFTTPGFTPPFLGPKRRQARLSWDAREVCIYPMVDGSDPGNLREFCRAGEWVIDTLNDGRTVDVGCIGGHGRTGTMLATILVLQGVEAHEARNRVWDDYCEEAIETVTQINFIQRVYNHRHGLPLHNGIVNPQRVKAPASYPVSQRDTFTADVDDLAFSESVEHGTLAEQQAYAHYLEVRMTEEPLSFTQWQALNYQSWGPEDSVDDPDKMCAFPPCVNPATCDPIEGDCFAARLATTRMQNREVNAIMEKMGYDDIEWEDI